MKLVAIILLGIILAACGGRGQLQVLSDAKAGAQAYRKASDPKVRAELAEAVIENLLAGLEHEDLLPPPTEQPDAILVDVGAYAAAAAASLEKPPTKETPKAVGGSGETGHPLSGVLEEIGYWCAWAGGGILGLATLGWVLWLIPYTHKAADDLLEWIEGATVVGAAALGFSYACYWLADNLWVVGVVALLTITVVAIRTRKLWVPVVRKLWAGTVRVSVGKVKKKEVAP